MRFLFTSDYLDLDNIGGSGRVILEVATRLEAAGHAVGILAGGKTAGRRRVSYGGATLDWSSFPFATTGERGLAFFFRARRAARAAFKQLESDYDVLIHNQPFTTAALARTHLPSLYIFHSPWPLEYLAERFGEERYASARAHGARARFDVALRRHLEARALLHMDRIITLSESMKTHAMEIHGLVRDQIAVLPGGVDLARFHPVSAERCSEIRRRWGVGDEFLFVCVRRLIPRTGVDMLLEAFALGSQQLARTKLLIAGAGPERDALVRRAHELGLDECVRFIGYVPDGDLPDLYGAADLAVVPTRALEGFGLATLEALACNTPVVATPVGGSVEILRKLCPELLADKVSARSLANVICEWSAPGAPLAALRARCRHHVESHYSWQHMARGVEVIAQETLAAARAPAPALA